MTDEHIDEDQATQADRETALEADSARVPTGSNRTNKVLFTAVAVMLVGVLAVLLLLTYVAISNLKAPRTAAERNVYAFQAAVEQNPLSDKAWAGYVAALIDSGQYATARSVAKEAEDILGETGMRTLVQSALLMHAQADSQEAIELLDEVLEAALEEKKAYIEDLREKQIEPVAIPASEVIIEAAIAKGDIHTELKQWDLAVDAYTVALEEKPTMSDVLVARGDAHAAAGRDGEALIDYEEALIYAPEYGPAHQGIETLSGGGSR